MFYFLHFSAKNSCWQNLIFNFPSIIFVGSEESWFYWIKFIPCSRQLSDEYSNVLDCGNHNRSSPASDFILRIAVLFQLFEKKFFRTSTFLVTQKAFRRSRQTNVFRFLNFYPLCCILRLHHAPISFCIILQVSKSFFHGKNLNSRINRKSWEEIYIWMHDKKENLWKTITKAAQLKQKMHF